MRVPSSSPQNNQSITPIVCNTNPNAGRFHGGNNNNNNSNNNSVSSCYEPTSVLDLRGSPSPATEKLAPATSDQHQHQNHPPALEWEEQVLRGLDWDSIMRDLGLDDDSSPNFKTIPQFIPPCSTFLDDHHRFNPQQQFEINSNQFGQSIDFNLPGDVYSHQSYGFGNSVNNNNINVGFDFIEELIRAADCFDSNELQLAQVILTRLNQRLRSPVGKPLQRAAFFFKEALQSVLAGSTPSARLSSWSEIVQMIKAYKAFSTLSPIPMFAHFTANQALLDSLDWPSASSAHLSPPFVHIVDFDIGFGGQYASLMKEIAYKTDSCRIKAPFLRVTAIVPEEYAIETKLVKENLTQFAKELQIRFQIEFVLMRTFEVMSFKSIKFMDGEKLAVLLSPVIFRRLNGISGFVNDLRCVSPSVVIFVDGEGWTESTRASSFRRDIVSSLELYSMMFESLDTAAIAGGTDWVRKIELLLLRPKIVMAVEGAAGGRPVEPSWREVFIAAGMRAVPLSQFADFQAECLLGKVQVRGFHVAKRQAELVLCWHQRSLVATSAWKW